MSEELKKKLNDYEVNPPEKMWSRIAAALDEEVDTKFSRSLYNAEVMPPSNAWNTIANALEATSEEEYPARLYNLEVDPPVKLWTNILAALDKRETLPQIPSKRKIAPFVKYASAACLIGIIAFGAFKFFTGKTEYSVPKTTVVSQNSAETTIPDKKESPSAQSPVVSNNLPKEGTALAKANVASRKKDLLQQGSYMTQIANPTISYNSSTANNFQQAVLREEVPGNCSLISDTDPYLMFMNPDGYLIRISKKLAETLGCVYTKSNSNEYKQCESQITKWRDKIAQSPASSSPDNFMNILDIIKLQDN